MYQSSASSDSSPTGGSASTSSGGRNRNDGWAMVETLPTRRAYSHPNSWGGRCGRLISYPGSVGEVACAYLVAVTEIPQCCSL